MYENRSPDKKFKNYLKHYIVKFGKYKGKVFGDVINDNQYWIWFFKTWEDDHRQVSNIKKTMCWLAIQTSKENGVECGFLREYGNDYIKQNGLILT